jgi:hypothetical protein
VASGLGLDPAIAWVDGDDLMPRAQELGWDGALTANAYLGGFGIARALSAGADVVVTGRVTDASVVVGPAIWRHGWSEESYDELAGAVVAGHVIECGCQATGGNFSGWDEMGWTYEPLPFPIAEVAADGSSVITKHVGTGGQVSVDTVTAQLLYEIQGPLYLGPDVTVDLSSVQLAREADDRVRVSGVRGSAPPEQLKVCVNELGGYRNQVELVLTGLDIHEKAHYAMAQLAHRLENVEFGDWHWSGNWEEVPDSETQEGASRLLRLTVMDPDPEKVGRVFTAAVVELALASYPGFTMTAPPGKASAYGVYRPEYVDRGLVTHTVHLPDGTAEVVDDPPSATPVEPDVDPFPAALLDSAGPTRRMPLGFVAQARSGDKGGDANIGLWVSSEAHEPEKSLAWLAEFITPERIKELLQETEIYEVTVHPLPNLRGLNVVVHGLLGEGVAAGTRFDPQAKALGEWLRSRRVDLPEELMWLS